MAAGTANAAEFVSFPKGIDVGATSVPVHLKVTIPAVGQETADDRINLFAFPATYNIVGIDLLASDAMDTHATPTVDADLMIVTGCEYPTDTGTEATVYNAGTRWQAAKVGSDRLWVNYSTATAASAYNGLAYLRWKVITGAATASAGTITMIVWLKARA